MSMNKKYAKVILLASIIIAKPENRNKNVGHI